MGSRLCELTASSYRRSFGADLPHGDRDGLELRIRTEDGRVGAGEVAPLADFGSESLDLAFQAVSRAQEAIRSEAFESPSTLEEIPDVLEALGLDRDRTPVAYGGLELALLDVLARRSDRSLARILAGRDVRTRIPVNALVSGTDPGRALEVARRAAAQGFGALKIKVGTLSPDEARELLGRLRSELGPHMTLRADANRAWSPAQTRQALEGLGGLGIDYLEEPCAFLDGDPLISDGGTPIALDESACPARRAWRWLARVDRPRVFILKPLIFGGLLEAWRFAEAASAAGSRIVVTSALEGPIGLAAAVHFAAALPFDLEPAGLATASWTEGAAGPPSWLMPERGALALPDRPGLGLEEAIR